MTHALCGGKFTHDAFATHHGNIDQGTAGWNMLYNWWWGLAPHQMQGTYARPSASRVLTSATLH